MGGWVDILLDKWVSRRTYGTGEWVGGRSPGYVGE